MLHLADGNRAVREMGEAALRNQRFKRKRQGKAEDQSKNDVPAEKGNYYATPLGCEI